MYQTIWTSIHHINKETLKQRQINIRSTYLNKRTPNQTKRVHHPFFSLRVPRKPWDPEEDSDPVRWFSSFLIAPRWWMRAQGIERHWALGRSVCGSVSSDHQRLQCEILRCTPSHFDPSSQDGHLLGGYLLARARRRRHAPQPNEKQNRFQTKIHITMLYKVDRICSYNYHFISAVIFYPSLWCRPRATLVQSRLKIWFGEFLWPINCLIQPFSLSWASNLYMLMHDNGHVQYILVEKLTLNLHTFSQKQTVWYLGFNLSL